MRLTLVEILNLPDCDLCGSTGKIINGFDEQVNCPICNSLPKSEEEIKTDIKRFLNFFNNGTIDLKS